MSAESATMAGRSLAESLMLDRCLITEAGAAPLWDETQGAYVSSPTTTIYDGICQLRQPNPAPLNPDTGEQDITLTTATVKVPILGTESVAVGHVVTITAATMDAALVGSVYTVVSPPLQTYSTARRLVCQKVTA